MIGHYDTGLVLLSVLVAMTASYTALDLAGRVTQSRGRSALGWLVGGASAMGGGIWAMHFIGMLAFSLPVPLAYDFGITAVSMLIAALISGFALALVSGERLSQTRLLSGGIAMGIGICAMHYTGMAAMRMMPPIHYDPALFAASVLIAIGASIVALRLAFSLRAAATPRAHAAKFGSAVVMGLAISGMHYTGMAAAQFAPGSVCLATGSHALAGANLALTIGTVILSILAITLMASQLDARVARRTAGMLLAVERANRDLKLEIGARERAEEVLRESEERFRSAFDYAPIGMTLVSPEGRLLKVNQAFAAMLGYSEQELLRVNFQSITHPDDLEKSLRHYRDLVEGRIESFDLEKRYIGKQGDTVWAFTSALMMRKPDGSPLHCIAQIQNITERKRMAEDLDQRTEELERSNRELSRFAYVASHDLQAPLRSVTSFVQLLQRHLADRLDAKATEYMQYIVEATQSMHQLIRALLELGRIGQEGINKRPVDLNRVVAEARKRLQAQIAERGAIIHCEFLPELTADETLLIQLMQNLLNNAIKFQKRQPPEVNVSAERGTGEWKLAVRDRGIGIDPKDHERIFQIFQRLHSPEEYDGSGIGLSICEKIVRLHDGRIWVESQPGEGSTFYFSIPDAEPARVS